MCIDLTWAMGDRTETGLEIVPYATRKVTANTSRKSNDRPELGAAPYGGMKADVDER